MASTQSKRPLTSRNTTPAPCRRNIRQSTRRRNGKKRKGQHVGRKILENKKHSRPERRPRRVDTPLGKRKQSLLKALTKTSEEQQRTINNLCDTQKQNLTGQYQTYKENIENIKANVEQLYENIKTTSKTEKETFTNTGDIKKSEIEHN